MKRKIIALVAAALMTIASATVASAYQFTFDPDGTGALSPILMDSLSVDGTTTINVSYSGTTLGSPLTFTDSGILYSALYHVNGTTGGLGNMITANFSATGNGVLGGGISFNTGSLTLSDGATPVGTFILTGGTGFINPDGTPLSNGIMTLTFKADTTALNSDYWGDTYGNPFLNVVLGFATTNASVIADSIKNQQAPYTTMVVENGGQFRVAPVPEPSTIALVGLGLAGLGIGAFRRKK